MNVSSFPILFKKLVKDSLIDEIMSTKLTLNLNTSVIGCHLRGTDLHNENAINRVKEKINEDKEKLLFICSDEQEIEEEFKMNRRTILNPKSSYVKLNSAKRGWGNNCLRDSESVKEALKDMCLLSFCNIQNNDYHTYPTSTFLHISRLISGWES